MRSVRLTPIGTLRPQNSMIFSTASRTACAWSISGVIRRKKSNPPISSPAKTKLLKLKSEFSPTLKNSTPPRSRGSTQLYEGGSSAEAALRDAIRNVDELARYDGRFAESAQQLASARATISDIASGLRDYAEGINASPERLAELKIASPSSIGSKENTARPSQRLSPLVKTSPASLLKSRTATKPSRRSAPISKKRRGISKSRFRPHRRA